MMGRAGTITGLAVLAATLPSSAGAVELRSGGAIPRDCAAKLYAPATAGIDRHAWRAPMAGLLTADLDGGPRGDWDLALFHGPGPADAASTSFASDERASLWV